MNGETPNIHGNLHSPQPIVETKTKACNNNLEKKKMVEFILKLYHDKNIQSNGLVSKKTVIKEFGTFVKTSNNAYFPQLNVGTLMRQNKFLLNTPRGSQDYCISMKSVFEFCNENLELFDATFVSEMSMHWIAQGIKESTKEAPLDVNELHKVDEIDLSIKDIWKSEFAKDKIAEFVLNLYHNLNIQPNGLVPKTTVWREFHNFVKTNNYGDYFPNQNIGKLLQENKYLYHTFKGSTDFRISFKRIFESRNQKLKEHDEKQKASGNINANYLQENDKPLEVSMEVSTYAEEFPLLFEGGCKQQINEKFTPISLGCFICQTIFKTQSEFEDHISIHGFESDFEFTKFLKITKKTFTINYRLCDKSHYFCFTMTTNKKDVIIEKIIIVHTKSMHFVKNDSVPYELASDGIDSFLVDSHLFTIGVEQPILVIYRYKSEKMRFVEQHHFLRTEEFPKVFFSIRSCRLSNKSSMKTSYKLKDYYPDATVKASQRDNFSDESLSNVSSHFRNYIKGETLNENNVCNVFNTVLQIEDLEGQKLYLPLYQKAAEIKRFGREYSVKLKKLPKDIFLENIVSPLDEIILTLIDLDKNGRIKSFSAYVERVYYDTICFQHNTFIDEKEKYNIMLRPSRLSLKYQLRALEMLSTDVKNKHYLFPVDIKIPHFIKNEKMELFNPSIENNFEQLQAVRNIAVGPDVSAPYVLFGPPGTGKTSTIVEIVLQLWQRRPKTQILITAGSNSACDEVALRLLKKINEIQPETPNIIRLYAKSNEKRIDSIEDALIEASNLYCSHFYPSVESIKEYRIIVCTLSVVGKLVSAKIGSNFFTHIFVDECGALTEPEVLVGWMGTSSPKTRLIVSGDHKQLGPILKSTRAASLGLEISLMERLLNSKCYEVQQDGNYNRSIQTRLIRNYRSHPEIVALYNSLYYNNELKALAPKGDTVWDLQWHLLPNRNHPIIFHSVYGNCNKKGRSISLCNEQEINTVMDYVKDLMYFGMKGRKIEETDIGIISPYKKQFTRIQEELFSRGWNKIEVGSVETFQGREKNIIIVSTVRSYTKTLGFLENPRRLNVILSRAKALLIMIGNPKTLSQNKDYKFIIDECVRNQCIFGSGLRGPIETNLDSDIINSKPQFSVKKRRNKKMNSKLKKSQVVNKENNTTLIEEFTSSNTKDFENCTKILSNISTQLETIESTVNHISTSENKITCANVKCKEPLCKWPTENDQYKPKRISTTHEDIPNKKPLATVFPRTYVQKECIPVPPIVTPVTYRERPEVEDIWNQNYFSNYSPSSVIEKRKKSTCIIS